MAETIDINEVVSYNVQKAREVRELTQPQALRRLRPFVGSENLKDVASLSSYERTWQGKEYRHFDANLIVAFASAYELPIPWFFMPIPSDEKWFNRHPNITCDREKNPDSKTMPFHHLVQLMFSVGGREFRGRFGDLIQKTREGKRPLAADPDYARMALHYVDAVREGNLADLKQWADQIRDMQRLAPYLDRIREEYIGREFAKGNFVGIEYFDPEEPPEATE